MLLYVVIAGVLGLFPGISYFLIIMETWMIFNVAHGYHVDNTGEIAFWCTVSAVVSAVLKTVAHTLHLAPVVGQIANSIVAMLFVAGVYTWADAHYEHLAKTGQHRDTIQVVPQQSGR